MSPVHNQLADYQTLRNQQWESDALQHQGANYYNTGDIDKNSIISRLIHIEVCIVNMLFN